MKFLYLIIISIICLLTFSIYSQPSITWQRLYNGPQSQDDDGTAICQSDSGNFYIAGSTFFTTGPSFRVYVIKINPYGDTIWAKVVLINGGNGGGWGLSLMATEDGGCVVSGESTVKFLIRLNPSGDILWQFVRPVYSQYYDIKRTFNGDFICAGISSQGGNVLRIDSSGNLKWDKTYAGYFLLAIQTTNDNGCYVGGYTTGAASIIKLDSNGNLVWSSNYKINNQPTLANSFRKDTVSNNYILTGNYWNGTNNVPYFIKFNSNMTALDTHILVLIRTGEVLESMEVLNNNRYVWTFYFQSTNLNDSSSNRFLITDSAGNTILEKVKYTKDYEEIVKIKPVSNGDIIFLGDAEYAYNPALQDIYIVRTDSLLNFPSNIIGIRGNNPLVIRNSSLKCYPNPSNNFTIIKYTILKSINIKIVLYDLTGREVKVLVDGYRFIGNYIYNLNTTGIASGVYALTLKTNSENISVKIVIIK